MVSPTAILKQKAASNYHMNYEETQDWTTLLSISKETQLTIIEILHQLMPQVLKIIIQSLLALLQSHLRHPADALDNLQNEEISTH
ncbi:hypothetical protein VNO77_42394 [Canavalia gladiata]|uniref:Uncharacterized protein n=1 Tax=Canavalia gladiata TaxID=3824 RepID=A0AAN9JUM5_CANGL